MVSAFKTKEIRDIKSVGERLRMARRRRRLSLEDAERDTKIRLKYLEALEKNYYQELPSEVYALGFLRRYSEYLKLKAEPLIDLYKTEKQAALTKSGKSENQGFSPIDNVSKWQFSVTPRTGLVVIVAIIIMGLLGYIWWSVAKFSSPPLLSISQPRPESVVNGDSLTIKGSTDTGSSITINNESVNVSPDGTFSQSVSLVSDLDTIQIIAKNNLGKQTLKTIKILAEKPANN